MRRRRENPTDGGVREVGGADGVRREAGNPVIMLQRAAGNQAVASSIRAFFLQRQNGTDSPASEGEELQAGRARARTQDEARALVDSHVSPRECFIELENRRAGWRPITGTGCAHWVAHQRGGPRGTTVVCQLGFKYRVTDLLQTLSRLSPDLRGARVGAVWSSTTSSHVGIVRSVTRDEKSGAVVSVEVENDSSRSGGVVTQTKTDGAIYD